MKLQFDMSIEDEAYTVPNLVESEGGESGSPVHFLEASLPNYRYKLLPSSTIILQ
jgi:hypothetical protein